MRIKYLPDGRRGLSGNQGKIPDSDNIRIHSDLFTYGSSRLEPVSSGNRCLSTPGIYLKKSKRESKSVKTTKMSPEQESVKCIAAEKGQNSGEKLKESGEIHTGLN